MAFIIGQDSFSTFETWYEYETSISNAFDRRESRLPLEWRNRIPNGWKSLTHNPEDRFSLPVNV